MNARPPATRAQLADGLRSLGVGPSDTVLLRAALRAIGPTERPASRDLIDAFFDVTGPDGTLVSLAFTQSYWRFRKSTSPVYTSATPPITGGFAAALLAEPGALRSNHPLESFVAVGARARQVVEYHDKSSAPFAPVEDLIRHGGKMILVGCTASSPGFSTVHLAQERLGLSRRSIERGLQGVWVERNGLRAWHSRDEIPGCSAGFWKFYSHYVRSELLVQAYIGAAYSLSIRAPEAYAIEEALLRRNPRFALCDRPLCISCRATRTYNKRDWPSFLWRAVISGAIINKLTARR